MTAKPVPTRYLGIDFGLARVGIALSDETKIIASPLKVMPASKKLEETVIKLTNEITELSKLNRCQITKIIIGLPLKMSGKQSMMSDEVRHFADLLGKHTGIEIVLWDERLSTLQADRALREFDLNRKKRAAVVDAVTASIILQAYLDSQSILTG
jgi:putative Holliday junction resolvase